MKLITFAVPCYNSAAYMDHCIESLLIAGDAAEILIINDGSAKDNTAEKADEYEKKYPHICRAIHKENGGHGDAVSTGIHHATGLYFKVVDSDDWLDADSLKQLIKAIKEQIEKDILPDLILTNYVYERVLEDKRHSNSFRRILPAGRIFSWNEMNKFNQTHYLTMHTMTYRTEILIRSDIQFPKHTFYVDNLYAYLPLDIVERLYYIDCDMYRYYIGREDQSVNESIMIKRLDQQLRVTKILIDSQKPHMARHKYQKKYILHFLLSMMMVSSIFCLLSGKEGVPKRDEIWQYLQTNDPESYRTLRRTLLGVALNCKSQVACRFDIMVYRLMQKIYKFN
ncbi:MAG: glycosyltransferase family 2 protein [Clostridiales bacterium]|nr:glycosyltransferase family 2 protein [Clostridiales bacterium]